MATAAELRQILKQDAAGKNLYDHLTETLMKILIDKPANSYDHFELISSDVKSKPFDPNPEAGRAVPPSEEEFAKKFSWAKKCAALLKVPDEPPEDTGVKLPDLLDEANLLEWAGVSIGRYEAHRLFLSMKKLSESLPGDVGRLRFFGKIFSRGSPYVIVEGLSPEDEEGTDDKLQEGRNGGNKYAYWVARSTDVAVEDWVKLPNVTMAQVVVSRKIKRILSGDIDAPVPSFPPFPGTERNLLRAIIARIAGATLISPDGFFDMDDEADPPVAKEAEAEALNERLPKSSSDLKEPEGWKHHEVELNALGRVLAMPEVLDDEGNPVEPDEPVEVTPPLKEIVPEAWTLRVCPGGSGITPVSAVSARSLTWPGAVAVAQGRRYVNVYMGHGVMYEPARYTPSLPAPVLVEWTPPSEDDPDAGSAVVLLEQPDVKVDPTPPVPEGEEPAEEE